jgi:hypothetical protein
MNAVDCPSWRELYLAAVFEMNKSEVRSRIDTAQKAIVIRTRELFAFPANARERNALQSALVGLHALRSCIDSDAIRNRKSA